MRKVCGLVLLLMVCCSVVYAKEQLLSFEYVGNFPLISAGETFTNAMYTRFYESGKVHSLRPNVPVTNAQLDKAWQGLTPYMTRQGDMFYAQLYDSVTYKGVIIVIHFTSYPRFTYHTFSFVSKGK